MQITDTRNKITQTLVTTAANQDFVNSALSTRQPAPAISGWDPFEVWQRMIKQPRERRTVESA